jgi:hypothetical protein
VAPQDAPKASALVTLWTALGGSMAAASLVTLTQRREAFHQGVPAASVALHNPAVTTYLTNHPAASLYQLVAGQAQSLAYADAFAVIGVIGLAAVPLVALLRVKGRPS